MMTLTAFYLVAGCYRLHDWPLATGNWPLYFTISTRCGTFATMPRIDGVSSRSITWYIRVNPRPLITSLCLTGVQIAERTYLRCNFDPAAAALVSVFLRIRAMIKAPRPTYHAPLQLPCDRATGPMR